MYELRKFLDRSFLISVRESFIALLPFILINSLLSLIIALLSVWTPEWQTSAIFNGLTFFSVQLAKIFPLLALISLSFHFAKYLQLSAIVICSISLSVLLALHVPTTGEAASIDFVNAVLSDPRLVLLPILTAYLLRLLIAWKWLDLVKGKSLSCYLKLHLNIFLPVVICFVAILALVTEASMLLSWFFSPLIDTLQTASIGIQLFIRILLTHALWIFGVHGDNAYLLLIGVDNGLTEVVSNLTSSQFMDLFILYGGSGATLSLIIAILIGSKDSATRHIAKIAIPFSVFNINEILIYGLPIIFNPRLLLPFIISPALNFLLAYSAISIGILEFDTHSFPWITPPLINAYIASGHLSTVFFQCFLIFVGVLIYLPFVRRFSLTSEHYEFDHELIKRIQFQDDIEKINEVHYLKKQSESLKAEINLEKTIKEVLAGELQLHYQPKIALVDGKVVGFEALIRLKDEYGRLKGPYFIDAFQRAGYSHIIDRFVINTVAEDLARWALEDFYPKVSINIDPNNITDTQLLAVMIERLGSVADQVEIEMLESAFMLDLSRIDSSIRQLKQRGFRFWLDDFGTGFSSLSLLSRINVDGIKLDRSILANTSEPQGRILYLQICELCNSLGFCLTAEGVETGIEAKFVKEAGVTYVQGWLYAKAMLGSEAKAFWLERNSE